jgi:hypothetical protein
LRALIYEHLHVVQELVTDVGGWRLEIELSSPDFAWLQSLPDFQPEWLEREDHRVLARTGS